MEYTVKYLPGCDASAFDQCDAAEMLDYPWLNEYPDHFFARARLCFDGENLRVSMLAKESPLRATETHFGGRQCEDSCLEFFLCPFPEDGNRYVNIEINPLGTAHVGVGDGRHGRTVFDAPIEGMDIRVKTQPDGWSAAFCLPQSLFGKLFGKVPARGQRMKGNFYKCSGSELHEHYGCWSHVGTAHPDFHRPEYFGDIILE